MAGDIFTKWKTWLRDYNTDLVSSTGVAPPSKIYGWDVLGRAIDTAITNLQAAITAADVNITPFLTYAAMNGSALANGDWAQVLDDPSDANNGFWQKGGGSWVQKIAFSLPSLYARISDLETVNARLYRRLQKPERLQCVRGVFIGDSLTQRNHFAIGDQIDTEPQGSVNWTYALWPYFNYDTWIDDDDPMMRGLAGANQGLNGQTVAAVLANVTTRVTPALSQGADFIETGIGINDVYQANRSSSDIITDLTALYDRERKVIQRLIIANIPPVATTIPLSGGGTQSVMLLDSRRVVHKAVNDAIANYCSSHDHCHLLDIYSVLHSGDGSGSVAGTPTAGLTSDGLHWTQPGALVVGTARRDLYQTLFKPVPDYADPWDPQILPDFQASGGTAGAGVSGDVALGWTAARTTGSSITAVALRGTGGIAGRVSQIFEIETDGSGAADEVLFFNVPSINLTPYRGMWLKPYAKILLSDSTFWRNFNGGLQGYSLFMPTPPGTEDFPSGAQYAFTFAGPKVLIPMDAGTVQFYFDANIDGTVTDTGTLTIDVCWCGEVDPPGPERAIYT